MYNFIHCYKTNRYGRVSRYTEVNVNQSIDGYHMQCLDSQHYMPRSSQMSSDLALQLQAQGCHFPLSQLKVTNYILQTATKGAIIQIADLQL